jgi:hypothetical protein
MAKNLYFSRDSKLYVEFDGAVWQVPVLDGFSFSQSTNTSEITLSEMQDSSGLSRRGRRVFTDSLAPVEWSFSTYVRPYLDNSQHSAVEAVLWAVMAGADNYTGTSAGAIATLNGTITTNIDAGVAGTYVVYPTTSGTGTGAVLQIVVTGVTVSAISSVTILNPGTGYLESDTLIVPGTLLGDPSGNFVVTISAVAPATRDFTRLTNTDTNGSATGQVFTSGTSKADLTFAQSNRSTLGTCNLYFVMNTDPAKPMVYKISSAAINEASLDFEVDGIATIAWSGNGATIVDMQSAGHVTVGLTASRPAAAANKIYIATDGSEAVSFAVGETPAWAEAITTATVATSNFIRNRLTQLIVDSADTTTFPGTGTGLYNLTITGGNITITNNITYLVPEELGKVNIPIEHVTGARSITGSFTCYLAFETTPGGNGGTSSDFFNDLTSTNGLKKVVNDFDVTFQVGGSVASTPRLYLKIPKCHIEVPTHSIEDVISIETNFSAYTTDFSIANEMSLEYYGVTV